MLIYVHTSGIAKHL